MLKLILHLLLAGIALLFSSCAHQGTPGGGPDDTQNPLVLGSTPEPKSINVNINTKITIVFSEWLSPKSEKSVSIFPPVKLKIKVARNNLEIEPLGKFKDSTTYHLVINSSLYDLHNNPIGSPYSLVFSTGSQLDSGSIGGCVVDPSKEFLQPKIALFTEQTVADSGFTKQPDFLFQTDSNGIFEINNIGTGNYRIIAFTDKNQDSKFQGETEELYLPEDSIISISNTKINLKFYPADFDTTLPRVVSAQAASKKLIFGNWNRLFDSLDGFEISPFELTCIDSTQKPEILECLHFKNSTKFAIKLKDTLTTSQYRIFYNAKKLFDTISVSDTVLFNGTIIDDTTKPTLKTWSPQNKTELKPEIKITWSKPILFRDTVLLTDTISDSVLAFSNRNFSDTTILKLQRSLHASSTYSLHVLSSFAVDLSGNNLMTKDSTDTVQVLKIQTVDTDSIATSLQGGDPCLANQKNLVWQFSPHSKAFRAIFKNSNGFFRFDSIPSAKGTISYFIDKNQNGIYDKGQLLPWYSPEPFFAFSDTVEARARWDIEGVSFFEPCDPCAKKLPEPQETNSSEPLSKSKPE